MTNFFIAVLVAVALILGVVIGETYAPISGTSVQKLSARLSTMEGELQFVDLRCKKVETNTSALASHVGLKLER